MTNLIKYLAPPILIIATCFLISLILKFFIGPLAWIPTVLVYWSIIFSLAYTDSIKKGKQLLSYFKLKRFKWHLILIAILIGFMPFPIFILSFKFLTTPFLIISLISVAIINPFFEEIFWRGYMLENGGNIPFWIKVVISSLLFTISHPAIWGIFAQAMLTKELIISVFTLGLVWSFIYKKSNSLILPYFSHVLVDIFSCSVLAFMNLLPMIK